MHSRGTRYTLPMCLLWPHYRSHGRLWPLLKLKFGNCWLTSKCRGSSCKKINSGFQFQFQSFQFQFQSFQFQFHFNSTNFNSNSIPELELELSRNSNSGIELTPTLPLSCPNNTPHIPSSYNNVQTTKPTKAINNSYIYTVYIHITLDAHASRPVACHVIYMQPTIESIIM